MSRAWHHHTRPLRSIEARNIGMALGAAFGIGVALSASAPLWASYAALVVGALVGPGLAHAVWRRHQRQAVPLIVRHLADYRDKPA